MNTPLVEFVGAGPGAEDLITLRGLHALEQADLVVYAGSLVNPGHLKRCKPGCECRDSASMNLGEQVAAMSEAALAGKRVVRLHTGDPAMYGAINEQIHGLAEKGVASRIVPGVSSVFGAAAALGCELTCPDVSQSVVLTRTPGRTPMPKGEDAAAFARTGATLVFFLSTGKIDDLMKDLTEEGGLAPDTPAAVVYRASWPDERILRGTVSDIARKVEEAGFGRQALIFVGRALAADGGASRLYGADFSHGYRNHLANEAFDGRCALYAFTDKGLVRAKEIAAGLGLPSVIHSTRPTDAADVVHTPGGTFNAALSANWGQFDAHIFIGATGIAVRKIAPLLRDKTSDPAVLSCSESGSHVVSLTSGHLGGANRLARRVARVTGGQAVVSTATDVNGLPAFDEAAAQEHARILNTDAIRAFNAALLSGEPVAFCGPRAV
ncbi:precorrin-4 C(11)-methyltransferase, partial [uncultured Bilophila sp.]|uniref:precorrin-4 C(11)-methyltransferase n=1 Tax=uncultured Bilophila sp. TaxID=529385 RepID=UPI00280B24F1